MIVDDHAIVRQGLIRVLQEELGPSLTVDEASNGEQTMQMVIAGSYDLVLLDISLPDQNGLDILAQLRTRDPKLRVIILSTHPEEQYAVRAFRLGSGGYLNKGCETAELISAIKKVLSSGRYISPSQAELLANILCDNSEGKPLHHNLSKREHQVACMMTNGNTLTGIAAALSMSVSSISTYRSRLLEKLQLNTTADIINYYLRHNLTL